VLVIAGLLLVAALLLRDLTHGGSLPALVLHDPESAGGNVVVQVSGAVASPGLYELAAGARIQDAVVAAGGALPDANLDSLNLARHLRDGEKVVIVGPAAEVAAAVATPAPGEKLDLNVATAEQLDQLPGIGEAYARRIVDSRLVDGPYAAVDDLMTRRVIPSDTFDKIRDLVTVNAP
jgi:competence protein ComEA